MPTPRPILYVHHERAIGGAPLSLLYLIRQLDRAKWAPRVICLREGPAADLYRKEGLPVEVVPGPDLSHTELVWFRWWQFPRLLARLATSLPLFFRLRNAMRKTPSPQSATPPGAGQVGDLPCASRGQQSPSPSSSADSPHLAIGNGKLEMHEPVLVHLNSSTLAVAALAARSLGLPLVWHIREPLARGYLGFRRALLRTAIRRCPDAVVAICENDAAQLGSGFSSNFSADVGRVPSRGASATSRPPRTPPLHVIHNFVDFAQFDASRTKGALRKELGIPPEAPVLLYLGGSALSKGAGVLMGAASTLLSRSAAARLVVAGESSPEFIAAWIHGVAAGLRRRVHLLGVRMDVPALLADADLLLFPSTVPHFARPVIEAAAMGVPCVASDLGGVRELVVPGETGALVRPSDPGALAEVALALLADALHRRTMGMKAVALARERFDAKKNAALTFAVYDDLLRGGRA